MISVLKRCSACGEDKILKEFNLRKNSKMGRQSRCKSCQANSFPDYYQNNKEKYLQRLRDWRAKKKELIKH